MKFEVGQEVIYVDHGDHAWGSDLYIKKAYEVGKDEYGNFYVVDEVGAEVTIYGSNPIALDRTDSFIEKLDDTEVLRTFLCNACNKSVTRGEPKKAGSLEEMVVYPLCDDCLAKGHNPFSKFAEIIAPDLID